MKNWKKLLACLLVGLMALTIFTACDASVGAPMEPKSSDLSGLGRQDSDSFATQFAML